ncbi:NIPA-like protein 3 [Podila horticola]|nr:NIPA-like protein 3 [Podila horticola]
MPTTCLSDFDCLQTTRPDNWPREHATLQTGNYACVKTNPSQPGFCQFVVTAGEQCNVPTECAAYVVYSQLNLTVPSDLCAAEHCTLESTCGSPWQNANAPTNHTFDSTGSSIRCCGGRPTGTVCGLVGSNVDSCEYHSVCNFDEDDVGPHHINNNDGITLTREQIQQQGLGVCHKIDQRNHVWIGVVITLISSTVLNLGLNGQKYALRKHDERRVQKQMEVEEEQERWRQELGWTEEQVEKEADRLYEEKENRHGALYRKLKPYMFWRAIFVSKLWAMGLLVFIVGNLGGFVALRFAPQSLTAPLGSISLISNVIIAPLINKEVLGRWDIAGIFFIVAGSVIVVVFSGIVAQDYKLCVLINLFQKPATIIYLTFIGVCIIGTYFFIKFVEKNVENEADMAIGVSSEQQLQQEGRLYRLHSNHSNMSLSLSSHGGVGTSGAGASKVSSSKPTPKDKDGPLGEPLEIPVRPFTQGAQLGSNVSNGTLMSDASDTAVGPSSRVGEDLRRSFGSRRSSVSSISSQESRKSTSSLDINTSPATVVPGKVAKEGRASNEKRSSSAYGHRLTFDETRPSRREVVTGPKDKDYIRATDDGTSVRPELNRAVSKASSVMSSTSRMQRLRRKKQQQKEETASLTIWQRIQRIELIPSLPEHKLIRRDSPLLRFCLPLSYAALGGMMASYTVLFAKSLINLLVTSIFDGQNQFTSVLAWVILVVTVVTAVSQVYWINMGLKKYDALLQVPVFFTIWVLLDIVGGGIYYGEFNGFTPTKYVLFCLGVLIVFFGVALLAKRLALLAKEDVEGPSQSQAGSRRHSTVKESRQRSLVESIDTETGAQTFERSAVVDMADVSPDQVK